MHEHHHTSHNADAAGQRGYEAPMPPEVTPEPGLLRFFTPHEARTVDALLARILPASADGPGAREAGALNYVDYLLAQDDAFAQPVYRQPPFARAYEGEVPPPPVAGASPVRPPRPGKEPPATSPGDRPVIWVKKAELARYGFQSELDPREMYRRGLASLDRFCRGRFGAEFVDLAAERQDEVVAALAADEAEGFDEPGARAFFYMVEEHAIEGTFSDPGYGGNRDMAAWKAIGFLGAQRAYSAEDMKSENVDLEPQSLAELHHLHARMPEGSDIRSTLAMPMPLTPKQGKPRSRTRSLV